MGRLGADGKGKHVACCGSISPSGIRLAIAASILAARKLAQHDGGKRVPATMSAIADAVRWAEEIEILREIDRLIGAGQLGRKVVPPGST